MCTVVVRWAPDRAPLVLALRDELTDRPFDDPDEWWPEQPGVIGGRDQQAGGTWCATDLSTGVTALVLNRPQRRVAKPGAASRGVLPLLAVRFGLDWPGQLDVAPMASFAVVLVSPEHLTLWEYDAERLTSTTLSAGTHMVTAGLLEEGRAARHLPAFVAAESAEQWQALVTSSVEADDPASLLVRHTVNGSTYATVFGQVIEAEPGRVVLTYSRTPSAAGTWVSRGWPAGGGPASA